MTKHDNPPAFPRTGEGVNAGDTHPRYDCPGMSLRDWFAGQVLASASALPMGASDYEHRARVAYEQADAMLAARDEAEANARLIAAAPDLLEALGLWAERYKAVPEWRLRPVSDDQSFVRALLLTRAAITKATPEDRS